MKEGHRSGKVRSYKTSITGNKPRRIDAEGNTTESRN